MIYVEKANNFFYKFYNNQKRDPSILNFIGLPLYRYVSKQVIEFELLPNKNGTIKEYFNVIHDDVEKMFPMEISTLKYKIKNQNK